MERANPFELQVVFESGAYFSYVDPSKSVCIQLSDCDNWKAASKVVWKNLPADWSVEFFLKNGCNHNDADVYFWTKKGVSIGVHTFNKPQAVRSIYARPLSGTIPWSVARKCVQLRQHVKGTEDTLLSNNKSSDGDVEVAGSTLGIVGSSADGNISSNWFDPVEEEDRGSSEKDCRS
jgi:hypothetical protein